MAVGPRDGVRLEGDEELIRFLDLMRRRAVDLSPVFRATIDKSATLFFRRQFETKGAIGGEPWAPLRSTTRRARLKTGGNRGGVDRPLWDFGVLRGSLVNPNHPEALRVIRPNRYERGTVVPYAWWHQTGFTIRQWGGRTFGHARRVPARKLVPDRMPNAIVGSWLRAMERWVVDGRAG